MTRTLQEPRKVALVTGCSEPDSLGAAVSLELARRGYRVFATARNISTLKDLAAEGLDTLALDVTNSESIAAALAEVKAKAGRLDVLINNAGAAGHVPLLDADISRLKQLYDMNVWGLLAMSQAFVNLLVDTAKGAWGPPWYAAYGSSKLADFPVCVITVELDSHEQSRKNVDVTRPISELSGLYDLQTLLPAIDKMGEEVGKTSSSPKDIARALADAVSAKSPKPKLWIGSNSWVLGNVVSLFPVWIVDSLFYRVSGMLAKPTA